MSDYYITTMESKRRKGTTPSSHQTVAQKNNVLPIKKTSERRKIEQKREPEFKFEVIPQRIKRELELEDSGTGTNSKSQISFGTTTSTTATTPKWELIDFENNDSSDGEGDPDNGEDDPFADIECDVDETKPENKGSNSQSQGQSNAAHAQSKSKSNRKAKDPPPAHMWLSVMNSFSCPHPHCTATFDVQRDVYEHLETHEHPSNYKKTAKKGLRIPVKYLNGNMPQTETDFVPFECKYCRKCFQHKNSLRTHIYQKHKKELELEKPFKCNCKAQSGSGTGTGTGTGPKQCTASFRKLCDLTSHLQTHSFQDFKFQKPSAFNDTVPNCYTNKRKVEADSESDDRNTNPKRVNLASSVSVWEETGPFKCQQPNCEKSFRSNSSLRVHLISHSEYRPFKCSVEGCEEKFRTRNAMADHTLNFHNYDYYSSI